MGHVSHFMVVKFNWKYIDHDNLGVYLIQEYFSENLIDIIGFTNATTASTPFRSS